MVGDDETALLRHLVDSDDNHAPEIYRDWLAERGDPCAELFGSPADPSRTEELRKQWLGPLVDVTYEHQWRRGFLDGCCIGERVDGAIARSLGHRAWTTLRHLDASDWFHTPRADVAELLSHPLLDGLRSLAVRLYDFDELRRQVRPALQTLTVRTEWEMFPRLVNSLSVPNIIVQPSRGQGSKISFLDGRLVIEVVGAQRWLDGVLCMLPRELLDDCELRGIERSEVPALQRR